MFNLIQRYVIYSVLKSLILIGMVLVAVVLTVVLTSDGDDLYENHATLKQSLLYLVAVLPQKTFIAFPAVCLMGALFGMLGLSRHNELVAMYSAGAGLRWIIRPTLVLSIILGFGAFYWNEMVAAPLSLWGERMMNSDIKKKTGVLKEYGLLRGKGNRFIRYQSFDRKARVILDIEVREMQPHGSGTRRLIRADLARWDEETVNPLTGEKGAWLLDPTDPNSENYIIDINDAWDITPRPIEEDEVLLIEETPDDFGVIERNPIEMSHAELKRRIALLESDQAQTLDLQAILKFKVAAPYSVVALILIGLCFGASPFLLGREGAARFTYPLGICLGILGLYYAISLGCLGLGQLNVLSPFVSAWLPNVLFLGFGIVLLVRS
ncbi:MAG: LptF/LptG family permease [Candidatus Omnitrophica bacterium]|nr:LptF/LptG family permease [Candidatus Omnitrophota bacterium]MCA9416143.1 LptF/LptG family permease [Candidatus Omnitrophota bacterium]MCA9429785.1 LptF/LptG family permease [Candidatus Omnitrophota bacterium]MCA9434509.1 LptF/LptG family permease [Candidatus Omnitrophota bacterium]MCA9440738.1 LptF/LptG family permease [Candidatus Omnitrophota bacterium]